MGNTPTVSGYQQRSSGGSSRTPLNEDLGCLDGEDSPKDAERKIEDSHQEYAEGVQITDKQAKDMQERRENVVDNLKEEGLAIEEDHIYGSVMQGTMTGPLEEDCDVDVLVVLDADEHSQWATSQNGPQNALRAVKRRLEKKYAHQEIHVDRNVVAVKFSDFTVEVTPAFRYSDTHNPENPTDPVTIGGMGIPLQPMGADDPNNGYAIPDTYGGQSWVGTNPRKFLSMYDAVNENNGGNLQRVAVSAKKWNEKNGKPVDSTHMVMMAYKYFKNDAPAGVSTHEHMSDFFRNLPQYVNEEIREPVYQERVDKGMSVKEKKVATKKAYQACEKIGEAERLKKEGKTQEAKAKYREVYGDSFK